MNLENLFSFFQQNQTILVVIGLVMVGTIVINIIRARKMKNAGNQFILEHPDAAKVYLTVKALITSESVTVHLVDGEAPVLFTEKTKSGFYVIPGNRTVDVSYTYSRPGVMYKSVTETYGPSTKELIIKANKNYLLGFDKKNQSFTFDEIN